MEESRYTDEISDTGFRVLMVDDDLSVRNILYRVLENAGYDVLSASSGPEALTICRKSSRNIDLLVSDYNMPEMTGVELARHCSPLCPGLKVLYISGATPDEDLRADLQGRRRGFLAKPFRGEALLRKVKELLLSEPESVWNPAMSSGRGAEQTPKLRSFASFATKS